MSSAGWKSCILRKVDSPVQRNLKNAAPVLGVRSLSFGTVQTGGGESDHALTQPPPTRQGVRGRKESALREGVKRHNQSVASPTVDKSQSSGVKSGIGGEGDHAKPSSSVDDLYKLEVMWQTCLEVWIQHRPSA